MALRRGTSHLSPPGRVTRPGRRSHPPFNRENPIQWSIILEDLRSRGGHRISERGGGGGGVGPGKCTKK